GSPDPFSPERYFHDVEGRPSMPQTKPEPPSSQAKGIAGVRNLFDWLAGMWAAPRIGRVALCSPLVGLVAGLGAVGFFLALRFMYPRVLGGGLHLQMPPTGEDPPQAVAYPYPWWLVVLIPTLGGLISGILVFTWAPEAEGHGTDAMIRAFHRGGGKIRARVPVIKGVASIITIG